MCTYITLLLSVASPTQLTLRDDGGSKITVIQTKFFQSLLLFFDVAHFSWITVEELAR